jgi:hypothetical protein
MIQIENVKRTGAFVPQTNEEANGEILGRCNALHDWLMNEAESGYYSSIYKEVCIIMGFVDVMKAAKAREDTLAVKAREAVLNEKAGE